MTIFDITYFVPFHSLVSCSLAFICIMFNLLISSLSKLSSPEERSSSLSRSGMGSSGMGQRGRSWSNLSLGHAPSMSSVIEEPRRSTSTTSEQ